MVLFEAVAVVVLGVGVVAIVVVAEVRVVVKDHVVAIVVIE